ncbi:hypothetical protein ZWY2020_048693 [Hordeum vulgare]|nr:hypothetical protein ZWY2020_048693 [Hordeum vulgare]
MEKPGSFDGSSSEDAGTPLLLPVHRDDATTTATAGGRRPASSRLRALLAHKYPAIASGPVACAAICALVDLGGAGAAPRNMLGVLAWVFLWWVTDAVPLGVASMAPLFLFPAFGISSADSVAKAYMDDVIALVLRLHPRPRHRALPHPPPPRSQHHAAVLRGPGAAVAAAAGDHRHDGVREHVDPQHGVHGDDDAGGDGDPAAVPAGRRRRPGGGGAGGAAVLQGGGAGRGVRVGGGRDGDADGHRSEHHPGGDVVGVLSEKEPITFSSWMSFGLPVALAMFLALWVTLCFMYCSNNTGKALSAYLDGSHLRRELSLLDDIPGWGVLFHNQVGDGTVTIMMATLLFIIPSGKSEGEKLMDWDKCRKLQWNIVLLLGAGFAIADGFRTSGLTGILSDGLRFLEGAPTLVIVPVACVFSGVITEFMSDDSTTTLVLPLFAELARSIEVHPALLMISGAIGAQLSYLFPTGSPSNVVGFSTGHITIKDLVATGLPLKVVGVAALTVLLPTLGSVIFGMDNKS